VIHLSATADSCVTQSACVECIDWAKEVDIPISKGKAFFVITNAALAFDQCNRYSLHEHYVTYSEYVSRILTLLQGPTADYPLVKLLEKEIVLP